jgi:hypothetical protein
MKYLYGDSTPFPHPFDFLATLGSFMTAATAVVVQASESRRQAEEIDRAGTRRQEGLRAMQAVNAAVVAALDDALTPPLAEELGVPSPTEPHPDAMAHAARIKAHVGGLLEEHRRAHKASADKELAQLRADDDRRGGTIRGALEQFFRTARLPVLSSRVTAQLGDGKEPRYELCVVFRNQGDIVTSFVLATGTQPAWAAPRKVSDFVPALDLLVGVKKSFFKGTVSAETVHLADWIVSLADVHDGGAELALRRKPDQKDAYRFKLVKVDAGWRGVVERPDDAGAAQLPPDLDKEDVDKVLEVCRAVRDSITPLTDHRETLLRLELDGRDVLGGALAMNLVSRLVKVLAPLVESIAQRSPSPHELSLKKEHDDGRREEVYLRRDELLKKLQPLNAEGRAVFGPLGLEDWLPQVTLRPPAVRGAAG